MLKELLEALLKRGGSKSLVKASDDVAGGSGRGLPVSTVESRLGRRAEESLDRSASSVEGGPLPSLDEVRLVADGAKPEVPEREYWKPGDPGWSVNQLTNYRTVDDMLSQPSNKKVFENLTNSELYDIEGRFNYRHPGGMMEFDYQLPVRERTEIMVDNLSTYEEARKLYYTFGKRARNKMTKGVERWQNIWQSKAGEGRLSQVDFENFLIDWEDDYAYDLGIAAYMREYIAHRFDIDPETGNAVKTVDDSTALPAPQEAAVPKHHRPNWSKEGLTEPADDASRAAIQASAGMDVTFRYDVNLSQRAGSPRTTIRITGDNPSVRGDYVTDKNTGTTSFRAKFLGEVFDRTVQKKSADQGKRMVHAVLRGKLLPDANVPDIPTSGAPGWQRISYHAFGAEDGNELGFYLVDDIPPALTSDLMQSIKNRSPVSPLVARHMRRSNERLMREFMGHELVGTGSGYWISTAPMAQ